MYEETIEKIKSQELRLKLFTNGSLCLALLIIMSAEASANSTRLDGIRYGKDKD